MSLAQQFLMKLCCCQATIALLENIPDDTIELERSLLASKRCHHQLWLDLLLLLLLLSARLLAGELGMRCFLPELMSTMFRHSLSECSGRLLSSLAVLCRLWCVAHCFCARPMTVLWFACRRSGS